MQLVRSFLERCSRDRVFRRRLATGSGPRRLWVTPEASLKFWLPNSLNADESLIEFANTFVRVGDKVWDIGANIGVFTFSAAAHAGNSGTVLSVEADPLLSTLLIKSSLLTPESDAKPLILTVAVSDAIATATFAVPRRSRASNFIVDTGGCSQTGGVRHSYPVVTTTLDWLLENSFPPDIVKMDIEGMELRALSAADNLLSRTRPVFFLEIWETIANDITRLLHAKNYVLFDGEMDRGLQSPLNRASWCTLAIPNDKIAQFKLRSSR